MKRPQIVIIHFGSGELGDRIRTESITTYLGKSGFEVSSVRLPTLTRHSLTKEDAPKVLLNLFPLRNLTHKKLKYSPLLNLSLNLARNFLARVCQDKRFDVILAETSLVGWCALELARRRSKPLIVDVHGFAGSEAIGYKDSSWFAKEGVEREVMQNCTHLLAVSETMKKYMVRYMSIPSSNITIVPNGANLTASSAKFEQPLKIIYAGRFAYWENVDNYLEVAKRANPDHFRFYLAGSGVLKKHLLSRINGESLPVTYLGHVSRPSLLSLLTQMQVGIAPSTDDIARQVAFPIKVLDYMAAGLPVIAPRIGDWGRMIEQRDCGIVISQNSVEEYLSALEKIKERETWIEKSRNSLETIRESYLWETVLLPLKKLVEEFSM